MKYRNARIFTLFVSVVLSMAAAAQAQYVARTIKANVPFEFLVGSKQFPAGDYFLVSNGQLDMQLRDAQSRTLAIFHTKPVESSTRPSKPKLEFLVTGGDHVLSRVWQEGENRGQELFLPKSLEVVARGKGTTQVAASGGR